ncbi:hypothetical protein [Methanolobus psychrotolerans]|uniref:hypothetical protein n=1 Tax=Methanolobus psychrotolerans TaxID=1874706 RepID=UPI00101AEB09|nr:hypothetical protein [Methanolobus psychrotolerans]
MRKTQHKHVIDRHVTGVVKGKPDKYTDFFPTGNQVRPGVTTPAVMTVQDVDNVIKDSIQFVTTKTKREIIFYSWNPQEFGISKVETLVSTEGKFITLYPTAGSNVVRWQD